MLSANGRTLVGHIQVSMTRRLLSSDIAPDCPVVALHASRIDDAELRAPSGSYALPVVREQPSVEFFQRVLGIVGCEASIGCQCFECGACCG